MASVLLVVDVQRALVDWLEPSRRSDFLRSLDTLIVHARTNAIPIIYVQHADDELRSGTPGWQIAQEIAPHSGEPVIEKHVSDAFEDTELGDVLAQQNVDHLIICGMQTEFCIAATVGGAERRGYRVTLIADGHATYPTAEQTETQIRDDVHQTARDQGAVLMSTAEVISSISIA